MRASFYFGEVMLTWNESSSSRSAGVNVNKVILVGSIRRNSLLSPFDSLEPMENMRKSFLAHYASVLARYSWEPVLATDECAYAWLLNWAIPDAQHSMPITRCFKAHKRESQKSSRHFFSTQKLNMRNAP
jgi:hypothetical protein